VDKPRAKERILRTSTIAGWAAEQHNVWGFLALATAGVRTTHPALASCWGKFAKPLPNMSALAPQKTAFHFGCLLVGHDEPFPS